MALNKKNHQQGMTLIEMVVTVGILAILSVITAVAFPNKRDHQHLLSAEQQIQSYIRQAQQMALDQKREENCVNMIGVEESLCSKIGVAFRGNEVRFFADINDNNRYDPTGDYQLENMISNLPDTVIVEPRQNDGWYSYIFEADPPTVALWANGVNLFTGERATDTIVLETRSGRQRVLEVHPYAQVEVVN